MTEGTALPALPGVGDLFSRSWQEYRGRVWKILAVGGLGAAATLAGWFLPMAAAGVWAATAGFSLTPWILASLAALSASLWLVSWAQVAMMELALDPTERMSIGESWRAAWPKVARFSWVCILWFVVVCGGFFLLFVPGVYIGVALALAPFYCVAEGAGGLAALERSWAGARGRWWSLLWRLALIGAVTSAVSSIPYIGWILSGFVAPFALVATAQLYGDVVRSAPAAAAAPSSGRWIFAACGCGLLLAAAFAVRGALALDAALPDLEARGRSLLSHPVDPSTAQQVVSILEGGLTTENIDKAQQLIEAAQAAGAAAAPAASTAVVAGLPLSAPAPAPGPGGAPSP